MRQSVLIAMECRRVEEGLTSFLTNQYAKRPRGGFGAKRGRDEQWCQDTARRYRRDMRAWAIKVFDEAVTCGAISDVARPLVEAPNAEQIAAVRDLFGEIAEELERSSRGRVPV